MRNEPTDRPGGGACKTGRTDSGGSPVESADGVVGVEGALTTVVLERLEAVGGLFFDCPGPDSKDKVFRSLRKVVYKRLHSLFLDREAVAACP